jgi:hypothetical protein
MRRVGTISSAAGLIFLGVWMILNKTNPSFADEMFKWWPAIIILIGIEVLVYFSRKSEEQRVGFSFLIIPVIIVFIIVNIYQGFENKIKFNSNNGNGISFNNMIDIFKDIDSERYKTIDSSKVIDAKIGALTFNTNNADINIKKSTDGKVKVDLKIYVDRNENIENYSIKDSIISENASISINDIYIKKVAGDIYLPEGCSIIINTDNVRLNSIEDMAQSTVKIKSDNSAVTVNEAKELSIDSDNISADVNRIGTFYAKSDSGMVKINGSVDNLKLVMDNGKVNVDNESGKNVDIELGDGMVNYKTKIKNTDINLDLDNGICSLNGERRINSGITQKNGTGENKIKIGVDNGTLTFTSREW